MISNDNWPLFKLKDVATYISRGKQPKYVDFSKIRTLNQKAIQWGKIAEEALKFHNPEVNVAEKHFIQKNDVVINSTGTGTVGRTFHFKDKPKYKLFVDSHVTIVRTNPEILNARFLMYQMSTNSYQEMIISSFLAGSTGQVEFNKSKVEALPIYVPNIDVQNRIVHVLGNLDSKIELNKEIINRLEHLSQTLFKHWFINFEFPNEQGQPYKSNGGEMVESELGEIPKEWKVGTASNLFDFSPTEKLSKGALVKYVEMKDLQNSAMIYQYTDREFKSGSKFRNGDTLLARITPCLENGKIGFVDFLDKNEVGWGSTEFIVIRAKPEISKTFSYFFAADSAFKDYAIINMNGSSGRQRVKAETLAQYKVAIPPLQLIKQFTDIADANMRMMTNLKLQINKLEQLRDTLLPKLLSGEIEIPDELEV